MYFVNHQPRVFIFKSIRNASIFHRWLNLHISFSLCEKVCMSIHLSCIAISPLSFYLFISHLSLLQLSLSLSCPRSGCIRMQRTRRKKRKCSLLLWFPTDCMPCYLSSATMLFLSVSGITYSCRTIDGHYLRRDNRVAVYFRCWSLFFSVSLESALPVRREKKFADVVPLFIHNLLSTDIVRSQFTLPARCLKICDEIFALNSLASWR